MIFRGPSSIFCFTDLNCRWNQINGGCNMIIGIIKERKNPPDNRVALTPVQCVALKHKFPELDIWVESCSTRCFSDDEYRDAGIEVRDDISDADIMLGIKEVPKEHLIAHKTYFFFSHTIKKQPYNRDLLREVLKKDIRLVDYEVLKWETGQRVLGFGKWAGIVGAYNGLLVYGKKLKLFDLKPAHQCLDYSEIIENALDVHIPPIKIIVTGGGRVASGVLEFLRHIRIKEVTSEAFLKKSFKHPVFVQLNSPDLYGHSHLKKWNSPYFYANHKEYFSKFRPYYQTGDLLLNGIYWTEDLPRLFEKDELRNPEFRIKAIADISCDVNGSVPITYEATSISDPVIAWDRLDNCKADPYSSENTIEVMAVGNLPNELPKDASSDFGGMLIQHVIPQLMEERSLLLEGATIARDGDLTERYEYLRDYVK